MEQLFTDITFEKKDFTQDALKKGEYESCIFKHCELSNTSLLDTAFVDCEFIDCNLSLAKLSGSLLRDVKFKGCKMLGLHFETCNQFGLSFTMEDCTVNHSSFYQTKLKKTIFKNVVMQEVDFTGCDLTASVFTNCDLLRATFDNTTLEKVDFRTAFNYSIDPERNRIKKAKFSVNGLHGLLAKYDITIEQ
jgi:fluoroquinolone resistance protein